MIASVVFKNFKALRNTSLSLLPFNLVIGPNGSGKTSLIQAIMRLHSLSKLPLRDASAEADRRVDGAEITFRFEPPHDGLEAVLGCISDTVCDLLQVVPLPTGEGVHDWDGLRLRLRTIRAYLFDHNALALPSVLKPGVGLTSEGGHLAPVLAERKRVFPDVFDELSAELFRILPEYDAIDFEIMSGGAVGLRLRLVGEMEWVRAEDLSQGTLYLLGLLALVFDPNPPAVLCIEEIDRGIHPRLLREARDLLYRLSYPDKSEPVRAPVQVVVTTHSPYMLDLFRDYPEEVVVTQKEGAAARFTRLNQTVDLENILSSGSLGDLWFSGLIGGVPNGT